MAHNYYSNPGRMERVSKRNKESNHYMMSMGKKMYSDGYSKNPYSNNKASGYGGGMANNNDNGYGKNYHRPDGTEDYGRNYGNGEAAKNTDPAYGYPKKTKHSAGGYGSNHAYGYSDKTFSPDGGPEMGGKY